MNAMKKTSVFFLTAAAALALGSCGNKQHQAAEESPDDRAAEKIVYVNRDSTIYGLCGEGSAMNTLQLITDSGDTLNLSLMKARDNGKVVGSYGIGDRMAVIANKQKDEAELVINMTAMLGDWVMPNPIDGSSETGVRIKEGGVLEGIDQSSIIYKTWKIFNGKLEILSQRDGGGDEEETNYYDIINITPDSLVFKNAEDKFEYGRLKEVEKKSKVKFEDSDPDDFLM